MPELKSSSSISKFRLFYLLLFAVLLFLIYSSSLNASWHLDDKPNILENHYLHLNSLHPKELAKTFFTDPHNPERLNDRLHRPVSCLTFAVNWYFGRDNVLGYHLVNTGIHVLTAFLLFIFILNLFEAPNLKKNYAASPFLAALLASLLWAANPIQTQAVTYIVQRMAQLAAFFYLLGMFAYVKARLSTSVNRRTAWFLSCAAFYFLGVFSKPNAAMLPAALVLLELAFFQDLSDKKTKKKALLAVLSAAGFIFIAGSVLFLNGHPFSFLAGYKTRTFTLLERLLAEPRVVVFYLSQIFYPAADRLSIAHDITLSSSLFKPWTTLPSILLILCLVGFSLFKIRKMPILSFSILFFFLNHVIESSIIPLEIIFEHRNYLPSLFLFFPVAYLLVWLLTAYKQRSRTVCVMTVCLIVSLIAFFSVNTYIRNQAWKNDITLWRDAAAKAPNNARALNTLAIKLAWGDNSSHPRRYDMALKLFKDSLDKHIPSGYLKADIYGNMALIYFYRKNDEKKANALFEKALQISPGNLKIRRDFANALIIQRQFDSALEHVNILLDKNNKNGLYHNLKGLILLWQEKYDKALQHFKKAYELTHSKTSVVFNTGVALMLSGKHENAEGLFLEGIKYYPSDLTFYLSLVENSMRAGEKDKALDYAGKILQNFSRQKIKHGIETYTSNPKYAPISRKMVEPVIRKAINSEK